MNEIKLVIAESEELFKNNLIKYLYINDSNFSIVSLSTHKELRRFLIGECPDILLVEDCIYTPEIDSLMSGRKGFCSAKIILLGDMDPTFLPEGWEYISKYQKMDTLLQNIRRIYAEVKNNFDSYKKSGSKTSFVSFYSPIGGSGKTTLAIGCAMAFANRGQKAFYLNMEKISSAGVLMEAKHSENLLDVLNAIKKEDNVMFKIHSARVIHETGVSFFCPPDSGIPLGSLNKNEVKKLFEEFFSYNEYDFVVIDLSGDFSASNMVFLENSDVIVVPSVAGEIARIKLELFNKELDLRYKDFIPKSKIITVLNKMEEGAPKTGIPEFPVQLTLPYMSELGGITQSEHFWGVCEGKMNHLADLISERCLARYTHTN